MSAHNLYHYSHAIGFYGLGGRGFNNPVDVAIRRDGMLYVLNRAGTEIDVRMGYKRVSMCTLAEEYHGDFSSGGTGGLLPARSTRFADCPARRPSLALGVRPGSDWGQTSWQFPQLPRFD